MWWKRVAEMRSAMDDRRGKESPTIAIEPTVCEGESGEPEPGRKRRI